MSEILVAYSSQEGQTAKIAQTIKAMIEKRQLNCSLFDLEESPESASTMQRFGGVIIGASIHKGKHSTQVERFLTDHSDQLNEMPTLFLSVSLSGGSKDPEDRLNAEDCVRWLLRKTAFIPKRMLLLGGAVRMDKYGPITKFVMRMVLRQRHVSIPQTGELEFTDWHALENAVRSFVDELVLHHSTRRLAS